jgi:hypothetical protein
VGKAASSRQSAAASRQSPVGSRQSPADRRAPATDHRTLATGHKPAIANLDRIIHERLRLGIISALAVNDRLTFNDLKALLDTTDGNLSVHARKLEDAQYIVVEK